MSATKLLSIHEIKTYKTANASSSSLQNNADTPTHPNMSIASISILNVDKSKYFKNIRHSDVTTEIIFSKPYNCPKQFGKYCLFYSLIALMLCICGVVIFSGVKILEYGIIRDEYGHSFNINGTCLCISNVKTSYDWQQKWKIYNLTVCDGIKPKDYTFTSQSGQRWVNPGDIKPCYTNKKCTRIFTSLTTNVIIDEAIYLYVGSVLIFLMAGCGCIGFEGDGDFFWARQCAVEDEDIYFLFKHDILLQAEYLHPEDWFVPFKANAKRMNDHLLDAKCEWRKCGNVKSRCKLFVCKGCKSFYYCSRRCQKKHWKSFHSNQCKVLR
eukprot:419116_1